MFGASGVTNRWMLSLFGGVLGNNDSAASNSRIIFFISALCPRPFSNAVSMSSKQHPFSWALDTY
jgi:hypothetical protein